MDSSNIKYWWWYWNVKKGHTRKRRVENQTAIDADTLRKLIGEDLGGALSATGGDTTIHIERIPCHYGGYRYFFRCPRCTARYRIIYKQGDAIACRKCFGLSYKSQQLCAGDRFLQKRDKILKRLGYDAPTSYPAKPPGMHRATFARLDKQLCAVEDRLWEWGATIASI